MLVQGLSQQVPTCDKFPPDLSTRKYGKCYRHSLVPLLGGLEWESRHTLDSKKISFFLLLGFPCDATLIEKSFETGKRGVCPLFSWLCTGLGSSEPTVTLPGERRLEGTRGSRSEVLRNRNSSSSPPQSCRGPFWIPRFLLSSLIFFSILRNWRMSL